MVYGNTVYIILKPLQKSNTKLKKDNIPRCTVSTIVLQINVSLMTNFHRFPTITMIDRLTDVDEAN